MSLDQAFATARTGQPQAFPLTVTARVHTVSTQETMQSSNIIGKLTGSDPLLRDEYVVYTAHVDHLGICPPVNGDKVCHGTLDNAAGAATLLEIARAFTRLPTAPRRSVLFAFVTGEEKGLLGSDYFAEYPTVPRKALVANVNIDGAPGEFYAMTDVVVLGIEHSSLAKNAEAATAARHYTITPDPMPEEVFFIRGDQYSFVLRGIPAADIEDGIKAVDPKINGIEVQKKWLTTQYHTPLDNMEQRIPYDALADGSKLNFLLGYDVAEQKERPTWNAGDFFGTTFAGKY
jgi:Zn-dependent M28 family amino/carboxypeptidase